jgi:hypothetical protein
VWMMQSPRRGFFVDMHGTAAASEVPGIEEIIVSARPGQVLDPLPDGFLYVGFIFARAESPGAVESALRAAHACLEPVVSDLASASA